MSPPTKSIKPCEIKDSTELLPRVPARAFSAATGGWKPNCSNISDENSHLVYTNSRP